ncbi:MAG: hypothetical protein ACK559_25635, partial [bacterium]
EGVRRAAGEAQRGCAIVGSAPKDGGCRPADGPVDFKEARHAVGVLPRAERHRAGVGEIHVAVDHGELP